MCGIQDNGKVYEILDSKETVYEKVKFYSRAAAAGTSLRA